MHKQQDLMFYRETMIDRAIEKVDDLDISKEWTAYLIRFTAHLFRPIAYSIRPAGHPKEVTCIFSPICCTFIPMDCIFSPTSHLHTIYKCSDWRHVPLRSSVYSDWVRTIPTDCSTQSYQLHINVRLTRHDFWVCVEMMECIGLSSPEPWYNWQYSEGRDTIVCSRLRIYR